ncbi:Rv1535 domain-containing protein [Mycobacterium sp. SMC-2]|uniref:Rv1535 domain-containing protein n=1 Tax=Mycobacterium sp. SMC-2 TaxID=2857058 RepID=UPI0037CA612C
MTDAGGDPLVSSIAQVLKAPLLELYALLWRAGVVDVQPPQGEPHQICPDPSAHDSQRLSRRSPRQRIPAPAPSRLDPAVCIPAVG